MAKRDDVLKDIEVMLYTRLFWSEFTIDRITEDILKEVEKHMVPKARSVQNLLGDGPQYVNETHHSWED